MLIPSKESIEKIFRLYKNQCSFHDCHKKIIDSDNHVNGKMVFIHSNKKDHPRYNPKLCTQQLIDHTNLILFCDIHYWDIEKEPEIYTAEKLKNKLIGDLKHLPDSNFELTEITHRVFLHHFLNFHDPDRFSHITINEIGFYGTVMGGSVHVDMTIDSVWIKPTKHFVSGKFEIIDTSRKLQEFDEVIFYPANSSLEKGIQADIEIKSSMNIHGSVPNLPEGDYFVTIVSALDPISKLENDLKFTVIPPRNN